jgi:anti-anti-sigma factor
MEPTRPNQRLVDDVVVLDLQGTACRCGDEDVRTAIAGWIDRGRSRFLLNLEDVPHIDSAALAELVRVHTLVSRHGGRLTLANASPRVRELLDITRLSAVLELVDLPPEGGSHKSS